MYVRILILLDRDLGSQRPDYLVLGGIAWQYTLVPSIALAAS